MGEGDEEGGKSCSVVRGGKSSALEIAICYVSIQPTPDREGPVGGLAEEDWEGREWGLR